MKRRVRKQPAIVALIVVLMVQGEILLGRDFFEPTIGKAQAGQEQEQSKAQAQAEPEKIVAGPKDIKEKTAVYFFVGWLWAAIGVLIYVLRLKIKEVDRLYALKFFTPDRK